MNKVLASLLLGFFGLVNAQTQTTPNLITSGTSHTWTGVTTGSLPSGCATAGPCPGGPTPLYDPSSNSINFSYNANATVAQSIAINQALANAGAGVKINGYNYSYDVRNMNGDNRQGGVDTLVVKQMLLAPNGSTLLSSTQTHNTKFEWQTVSGTQTANTPIELSNASTLKFTMTGGDNGYWGGYFGPQVRNVNMSLNYGVDPCATNPAYSPNCAGYNTVNYSNNLVPNPNGYAASGSTIDQSYAINQALGLSGSGVMIHGFQWGYVANANGPYCASWLIVCWDQRTPSVTTSVNITSSTGSSLYSVDRTYTNSYNTTSYQYLFPSSRNLSTLGNFSFSASTNDSAYIGSMWSKAVYTPDPCVVNPLSSTSCAGYQQAFLEQQCASNPLYSTQCAGYAAAYETQQCSANPLFRPTCAGYATAYHDQQCSVNPLFASDCVGYQGAYHDQQCSINPLYATDCVGYASAYHQQQCSANPLYATDCPGYDQAYLNAQCIRDSLYSKQCTGYATAYAIKYLVPVENSASVNQVLSNNAAAVAAPAPVPTAVESATTTPSTTSATSVTSVTSVVAPPPPPAGPTNMTTQASAPPPPAPAAKEEPKPSGPPSARQALAERRQEAAKQDAVAKGKDLAKSMGNAKSMDDQIAVQGQVVTAMGYRPEFSSYQNSIIPDATTFYKPYQVYGNQKTIDNRSGLRMFGGSELRHQEMVDSQFKLGN